MKLTTEQLKSIYYGALTIEENEEGYLQAFQYTEQQRAYFKGKFQFWYERCVASNAKTLEFSTEATELSFAYRLVWIGSKDTVELAVDGLIEQIHYVKDLPEEGTISFTLPAGAKRVTIYLPADATIWIKDFEIDGAIAPVAKNEKVLWMGDSITQGYGPLRSAHTYVSVANRALNYDLINQGIGAYIYDKNVLTDMGYTPDKIIVAMGTNQHRSENMQAVEEYYETLHGLYGDTPVLCITPIWRGDTQDGNRALLRFSQGIKDICARYANITVIDGFDLVPHTSEYYLDNLHPNVIGSEIYGVKLVEAIRKAQF